MCHNPEENENDLLFDNRIFALALKSKSFKNEIIDEKMNFSHETYDIEYLSSHTSIK